MNSFDITGRVAVITGSTKGIGRAAAEALAGAGAKVTISSRTRADCESFAEDLNARFGQGTAIAVAADLGVPDDLRTLVEQTRALLGKIDILVCNAATNGHVGPMLDLGEEAFASTLNHNIIANHFLIKLVAPDMIELREGSIVIVSSIGGMVGALPLGAYNVSKAADFQMVRNLAVELGQYKVRVNALAPGLIRTDFSKILHENPAAEADFNSKTPLGRIGESQDIAGAVLFLASNASSYMTGQSMIIDGGMLAKGA